MHYYVENPWIQSDNTQCTHASEYVMKCSLCTSCLRATHKRKMEPSLTWLLPTIDSSLPDPITARHLHLGWSPSLVAQAAAKSV